MVFRFHGVSPRALHLIARATTVTVAKLLYAALAWRGFTHAGERDRLEKFISRIKRIGYPSEDASESSGHGSTPAGMVRCGRRSRSAMKALSVCLETKPTRM